MARWIRALGALAIAALLAAEMGIAPGPVDAQSGPTVIASGLTTPGGFTWNENEVLFVALAGSGGSDPVLPAAPEPLGPLTTGPTGAVAIIDDGCPRALATGIPSIRTPAGQVFGAEAVTELDGQLYLLFSNGGDRYGAHDRSDGVYRIGGDGSLDLVADHAAWVQANPPAVEPPDGLPNPGNPVAMVSGNGALWIADQSNGLVTRVTPGGQETLVADLSAQGLAPSDLALAADGSIFVSTFGRSPFAPGSAGVVQIGTDGSVATVWTGLTMASGVAIGNDGALYATEFASGVSEAAPAGFAASGRLVRQTGPDSFEVVADGLSFPSALATGPDGAVYLATGALGSEDGSGTILRYAPDGSAAAAAPANCAPIPETLGGEAGGAPIPTAAATAPAPVETPLPSQTPTATPTPTPEMPWTPGAPAPTGAVVEVGVYDYGIDLPDRFAAGPVTFLVTNFGSVRHGFAIDGPGVAVSLNRALEPGEQGAFSVELQAGTYTVFSPLPGDPESGLRVTITVS